MNMSSSGHLAKSDDMTMSLDLAAYNEQTKIQVYNTAQFTIDRFPNLNPPDAAAKSAMFMSFSLRRSKAADVANQAVAAKLLHFTEKELTRPLLNNLKARDASGVGVIFSALQTVMGDLILKKFKPVNENFLRKRDDVAWIASDLCQLGRKNDELRDELYLQLCKQVSGNPRVINRLRGWLLFSLYVHEN